MRCPIRGCGEVWELDTIHDQIKEDHDNAGYVNGKFDQKVYERDFFSSAVAQFNREGCAYFGSRHNIVEDEPVGHHGIPASQVQEILYDLLGDDVDGIEAILEDEGLRW